MVERSSEEASFNDALNRLEEEGKIESTVLDDDVAFSLTDKGNKFIQSRLSESEELQIMLLNMHWDTMCATVEDKSAQLMMLFDFVIHMRDEIGVNLLRVHYDLCDDVEAHPIPVIHENTVETFDP